MSSDAVSWNPLDVGFLANPYPTYAALREHDPVHDPGFGPIVVSRHADVNSVLRNSELSVAQPDAADRAEEIAVWEQAFTDEDATPGEPSILGLDPPDHTRLRRIVQRSFTPMAIARRRDVVERVVDRRLRALETAGGTADLMTDYAFPIPFLVICELLGLPESDADDIRVWSRDLTETLEPLLTPDQIRAAVRSGKQLDAYLATRIEAKRAEPGDDLLSEMIEVQEDGDRMDDIELLTMLKLLFVAGHETTVNLIGNGTLALIDHPEQRARLRSGDIEGSAAVDELLRYDSPVQTSGRRTIDELDVDGTTIAPKTHIVTSLGAANRDPEVFGESADTLDLGRPNADRHQSFGNGIHFCLGASLARLEGELAITGLVDRFPNLALGIDRQDVEWAPRIILRGVTALPVQLA